MFEFMYVIHVIVLLTVESSVVQQYIIVITNFPQYMHIMHIFID